jgi:transcriptional regulator of acetoin/glycerol metabolism
VLTHYEFRSLEQDYEDLLVAAESEVEKLFLRLVDSEYLVSLASAKGVMMLFRCDHQFLGDMSRLGVLPGSVWAEERQGTNGVGTCLQSGKSVVIAGKQHYGIATQTLSCITAPVMGRRNVLQSVINVTTARESDDRTNRVVLDIVERTARRIENRYFSRTHRDRHLLRLFQGMESTDLAEEGRIAVDDRGLIIDVSSQVAALTGFQIDDLIGKPAEEVFSMELSLSDIRPDQPYRLPGQDLQIAFSGRERTTFRGAHSATERRQDKAPVFVTPSRNQGMLENDFRIDPIMSQLLARAEKLYKAGIPLIVGGETGTGKTAFAHMTARRCLGDETETFLIDCAAISRQSDGAAVFHNQLPLRGTTCLILDRLDELNEEGQVALQTLLENRSQRASDRFGIIALTDYDFDHLAKSGKLKVSLLHRLKGGTVLLPPLRTHPELDDVISDLLKIDGRELGRGDIRLSDEARLVMLNYHWPGNVREMRNALRHALVLADGKTIDLEHLPEDMVSELAKTDLTARSKSQASRIEAALRHNNGNVSLTARYLGVSRATLYRKIQIQNSREKVS